VRRPLVWISVALTSGAAFASLAHPPFCVALIAFVSAWCATLVFIVCRKRTPTAALAVLAGFSLGACTYLLDAHARETPDELAQLAGTAGAKVVGRLSQKLPTPSKTHYLGKGKLEELLAAKEKHDIESGGIVVYYNDGNLKVYYTE